MGPSIVALGIISVSCSFRATKAAVSSSMISSFIVDALDFDFNGRYFDFEVFGRVRYFDFAFELVFVAVVEIF